ncbi:MAG: ribonuclease P protein component [Oscillospiraceae bacterium]|nr:ribonuclease P protein component [Oscillospiraceae bacterium]
MKKTLKLTENYLFRRIYRRGKSLLGSTIVLYYHKKPGQKYNYLGLTASKKIGGAVQRNRARRVMLESYRLLEHSVETGYTFVIVARTKATGVKMQIVKDDLRRLLGKIGAIGS